ncbi:MAG: DUF4921 family protein [candidate division KSB1 bacterium]|nr:DUF4921 family protein [candidate division KSB1 bacterium]
MDYSKLVTHYKDGSIKHRNPFSGTESWYSPDRKNRPILTQQDTDAAELKTSTPEDYCPFCESRYSETTPEKSRLIFREDSWQCLDRLPPDDVFSGTADFRRIGNLYEIISTPYWKEQYGYTLSDKNRDRKNEYLESDLGMEHVCDVLQYKLQNEGVPQSKIDSFLNDPEMAAADAFFGGSHELIIPRRHYKPGAQTTADLCSTGCLSAKSHSIYYRFSCFAAQDIYDNNPHVKYVCIYTNWGGTGGASLPHLHRQLLGMDKHGHILERISKLKQKYDRIYYDLLLFAKHQHLIICENDGAIAYADMGLPFPTISVVSKTLSTPLKADSSQLRPMSEIVHALHSAMGESLPCNEEWFYTPENGKIKIPWTVQIKWRVNTHAGFEGATGLYVVPYAPADLRTKMVEVLSEMDIGIYQQALQVGDNAPGRVDILKYFS